MARKCETCNANLIGSKRQRFCSPCLKERQRVQAKDRYNVYYLWLKDHGCLFCNIDSPSCLEVHHLSKNGKRYSTTSRGQCEKYNREDVEDGKAVILCANCHSTFHRHWGGKGADFPEQTEESTVKIIELEYDKWEAFNG